MTWNPESSRRFEEVSLSNAVGREERAHGAAGLHERYRASDGQSYGEWEFPEVAPLVFPALDKLAAQADAGSAEEGKKQNKMADKMRFVGEYWDKRATADYVSLLSNRFSRPYQVCKDISLPWCTHRQ